MRHIEFGIGRAAADLAGQFETVGLGQHRRHRRGGIRIVAQLHDRRARVGVADRIAAGRIFGDGVGIFAVAEMGARFLHGAEPGLVDELKQPARRRGGGGGLRIEVGFHLRGGEQIFEAGAGGRRGLPDRTRDLHARGVDTCRSRGARCVDRHVSGAPLLAKRPRGLSRPWQSAPICGRDCRNHG